MRTLIVIALLLFSTTCYASTVVMTDGAGTVTAVRYSANTPDYDKDPNNLINPDLSQVSGSPKYWKVKSGQVVMMNSQERTTVDNNEFAIKNADKALLAEDYNVSTKVLTEALIDVLGIDEAVLKAKLKEKMGV